VSDPCVSVLEENAKEGEHFLMHVFSLLNELECLKFGPGNLYDAGRLGYIKQ
jgi:hypothetical protein